MGVNPPSGITTNERGLVEVSLKGRTWEGTPEELRLRAAQIFRNHRPLQVEANPAIQAVIVKELSTEEVGLLTAAGYELGEATRDQLTDKPRYLQGDNFLIPPGSQHRQELYQQANRLGADGRQRFRDLEHGPVEELPTYVPDPKQFRRMADTVFEKVPVGPNSAFMILPKKFVYDSALTDGQRFVLENGGYKKVTAGEAFKQLPHGVNPDTVGWFRP